MKDIKQQENNGSGRFYINIDGIEVGEMTYRKDDRGNLIIDHTYVDEDQREKGLGGDLVKAAVEFARTNDVKIVPVCPFVKEKFNDIGEYSDVLK